MMDDPRPLSADVAAVLRQLRGMPVAHGIDDARLGPVAFGLALDARLAHRLHDVEPDARAEQEQLRHAMQRTTRAVLWGLGLLPLARVEIVPRDAAGVDVEVAELFPVPRALLAEGARQFWAESESE
jgi:hypothetical protein